MSKSLIQTAANQASSSPGDGKKKPQGFRIEKNSGPEVFAGAGSALPEDPQSHPAFYERVPVLEVAESLLSRMMLTHGEYYRDNGRFEIVEIGTYRGRGLKALLDLSAKLGVNIHVTGMDSFEGLPPLSTIDEAHAPAKASYRDRVLFADVTEREVKAYIGQDYANQFTLVKGFFHESIKSIELREYAMVIVDCDLYSSHMDVMPVFYERLMPGGVMFFDDYHSAQYPMAKVAIDEFLESKRERLFHLGFATPKGNNVKTYIIKK